MCRAEKIGKKWKAVWKERFGKTDWIIETIDLNLDFSKCWRGSSTEDDGELGQDARRDRW